MEAISSQLGVAAASSSQSKAPVEARSTAKPVPRVKKEAVKLPLRRSSRMLRSVANPNETPAQKRKREVSTVVGDFAVVTTV